MTESGREILEVPHDFLMPGSRQSLISAAGSAPKWVKSRLIKSNHEILTGITTSYNTRGSPSVVPSLCHFTRHSLSWVCFFPSVQDFSFFTYQRRRKVVSYGSVHYTPTFN
jgi:hypothetical protein